jgi:hypothetical protein
MKILYIHPDTTELRDSQCAIPIGVVGLSNLLISMGHQVTGISVPVEKFVDKNFNLKMKIETENPDVVLIDLHWAIYSYSVIEICRLVKEIKKSIITIIGGITASIYYKEILEEFDFIDLIIKGDSEVSIKMIFESFCFKNELLKNIPNISYRINDEIFHNDVVNFPNMMDKMNYYDYDFLEHNNEFFKKQGKHKEATENMKLAWIPTGRGCIYDCSYCGGNKNLFKDIFKYKCMYPNGIDSIMQTMEKLHEKYNISCFGITHDFGIFGKDFWTAIIHRIKKFNFKPAIHNYLFQLPDKDYIKEFIDCTKEEETIIGIPVICGSEDDRKKNGKLFTNNELFDFINIFINKKTKLEIYFIANPLYGASGFDETIKLIREIKNEYTGKVNFDISCGFEIIQPYSKKQTNQHNKVSLQTFKDYYYRYSFDFLEDVKKNKNIEYLVGEEKFDSNLAKIMRKINEVINE